MPVHWSEDETSVWPGRQARRRGPARRTARQGVVQPSRLFELNIANSTMNPATIPTRLKITWTRVNVDVDIPKIMTCPFSTISTISWSFHGPQLHDRSFTITLAKVHGRTCIPIP